MAQMASRASVEFYVGLALQSRGANEVVGVQEDAFIIRTFRNGVGVFIYKWVFTLLRYLGLFNPDSLIC